MYRSIRLLLPHYVAKEFLSFLFPQDLDKVSAIQFGNIYEVQQLLALDLSRNFEMPYVAQRLKYVTQIKRTNRQFSIQLPATLNLLTHMDAGDKYFLDISFSIQTRESIKIERVDSSFSLDLRTNTWACGEFNGRFISRDNNVPLELQGVGPALNSLLDGNYTKEKLQILLSMATLIRPTYATERIEYDFIPKARKICIEEGILTQDDCDLIDSETNFIIYGEQNELKYQPK